VPELDRLETERLLLRQPRLNDVQTIFDRYSSDPEVTRYLGWRRHGSLADTRAFVEFSTSHWTRWKTGPMLVISREDGTLLGSTGLMLDSEQRAQTGYVFARDAWGQGYATESLQAITGLAHALGLTSVYALCHPDHRASWRVLEKCGFTRDGVAKDTFVFPNLSPEPITPLSYSRSV
jgi:RimJ/RimL family protein N-acetyltransferase